MLALATENDSGSVRLLSRLLKYLFLKHKKAFAGHYITVYFPFFFTKAMITFSSLFCLKQKRLKPEKWSRYIRIIYVAIFCFSVGGEDGNRSSIKMEC